MSANNQIANLQRALELAQAAAKKLGAQREARLAGASGATRELGEVLRSVQNLHGRVHAHKQRAGRPAKPPALAAAAAATAAAAAAAATSGVIATGGGGGSGGAGGGGKAPAADDAAAAATAAEERLFAGQCLHELGEHMLDFAAIVDEWAGYEERRLKELRDKADEDASTYW